MCKILGLRSLVILSLFLTLANLKVAAAQDKKPAVEPKITTIELTVYPQALTDASYKMKLLPEERELKDGDAAVVLLRMIFEQQKYMTTVVPKFKQWLEAPVDDPDMLREIRFHHFYQQLRRAAYIRDADWNYPINEEPIFNILLPDVHTGRVFVGRGLPLYIRKQVADGNLELAQEAISVGLACSRHYARTPFAVCSLVGVACAKEVLNQADLLVQQPGAENLFWAYQKLPRPLFELQPAVSMETTWIEKSIPGLMQRPWPAHERTDEWLTIGTQLMGLGVINVADVNQLEQIAMVEKLYTYLRENWAEIGDETRESVDKMCPEEMAVRFYIQKSKRITERFQAALGLDPPEALKMMSESKEQLAQLAKDMKIPKIESAFPDLTAMYIASWAPNRKIVALQTVEALRHYAAAHDGQLPDSLDEITDLPIPVDPFTKKPMGYKLGNDSATLIMVNPNVIANREGVGRVAYKYRVRLAK